MKAPETGGVMSGQFSCLVNKWMDSSPEAGARVTLCGEGEREREEREWQPLLVQAESVTFDPLVEVSLLSSQLCLTHPSFSVSAQTQNTSSLFSLPICLSINTHLASSDFRGTLSWCKRSGWIYTQLGFPFPHVALSGCVYLSLNDSLILCVCVCVCVCCLLSPADTYIQITTRYCSWTVFGHRGRRVSTDGRSGVSCVHPPSGLLQQYSITNPHTYTHTNTNTTFNSPPPLWCQK